MSNNDFLDSGYEVPKGPSNYAKLEVGENKFRILSKALVGWEYFNNDQKPVRIEGAPQPHVDKKLIKLDKYGKQDLKHFWAMIVWNYNAKSIQILTITQSSIQNRIKELAQSSDWGSPYKYDITITKKGSGKETEYTVTPSPHKELPDEAKEAYKSKPCNIRALLNGTDPFAINGVSTPAPEPKVQPKVEEPRASVSIMPEDESDLPF